MLERIIKVMIDQQITGYQIRKISNGLISQLSADRIKNGKTAKPRKSTLELLVNLLCEHYNVSRDWLLKGDGEVYLEKKESKLFMEKHGVRFEAVEIVDHFVQNKDEFFKESEYLRLFVNDLVEKAVTKRLNELKEYIIALNSKS